MSDTWWINGHCQLQLPAESRGLAYGDGLFETMRLTEGEIPLIDYHMSRLEQGACKLGILIDIDELNASIQQAVSTSKGEYVLKLVCVRSGVAHGYTPDQNKADLLLRRSPLNTGTSGYTEITARFCTLRLAPQPALAGIKHLNRLEQVLAASEVKNEADDEGILLDNRDNLIEAISSNLILVSGNQWIYPDLSETGVNGVMQSFLKDQAHELGISVKVDQVSRSQLGDFEEILLTNAVRGVRNLGKIGEEWVSSSRTSGDRVRSYLLNNLHSGFRSF